MKYWIVISSILTASLSVTYCGTKNNSSTPRPNFVPAPAPSNSSSPDITVDPNVGQNASNIEVDDTTLTGGPVVSKSLCDAVANTTSSQPHSLSLESNKLSLKGEICAPVGGEQEIIFLIDTSNSMNDDSRDETVNNTCYRLQSAKAFLDGIQASSSINVSVIRVFDTALTKVSSKKLDVFKTESLTPENFCGQDSVQTNFEDGFEKAYAILSAKTNKTANIILMADDAPTEHNSTSNTAANGARLGANKVLGLDTKIVMHILNIANAGDTSDINLFNELTRDASKVISTSTASEANTRIKDIKLQAAGGSGMIDIEKLSAKLSSGSESKDLKIKKLEKHSSKASVFVYELEGFEAYGVSGSKTKNSIKIIDSVSKVESLTEFEN
jgi:hypothetical protein